MNSPKTPKGIKTKSRILDASIKLIDDKGFENVTLNDMCEASGVAIGTFYHYFTSTQEILHEIIRVEGEELLGYYRRLRTKSRMETLRRIIAFQLDYFERKGREVVAQIYSMELRAHEASFHIMDSLPIAAIIRELIVASKEAGELDTRLDAEHCTQLLLSLIVRYSFAWILDDRSRTLKNIAYAHILAEIERMKPRE